MGSLPQGAPEADAWDRTASSLPVGFSKWNRRPPGNENGARAMPPAERTAARV